MPIDDQPARAPARDDHRAGPDRQQHGDRRAQRDRLLRPAVIGAEVIEEERDVVVRKAAGDAEGQEAAGDDPGAAERARFANRSHEQTAARVGLSLIHVLMSRQVWTCITGPRSCWLARDACQSIAWLPASAGRPTSAHNFPLKAEATRGSIHRFGEVTHDDERTRRVNAREWSRGRCGCGRRSASCPEAIPAPY